MAKAVLTSWSKKPIFAAALSGRVVGVAELEVNSIGTEAELAYDIARPHWGRGLAVEAATEVVDWGFREFGLVKVAASANIRNRQSWRVMEKLGMTREGVFRHSRWHRGELSDSVAYAVLRDEWCGPHGPLPPTPTPVEEEDSTDRTWRELRTPRLLLRPFRPGDVDEVFNYSNDPEWAEPSYRLRTQAVHPEARRGAHRPSDRGVVRGAALLGDSPGWDLHREYQTHHRPKSRNRRTPLRPGGGLTGAEDSCRRPPARSSTGLFARGGWPRSQPALIPQHAVVAGDGETGYEPRGRGPEPP